MRKFWIERQQVVFGDRFLGPTPIGRLATVRLGPFSSWQKAKDARALMRGKERGRVVSD